MNARALNRVWVAITGALLLALMMLTGCGWRPSPQRPPADTASQRDPSSVAVELQTLAIWGVWLGGLAILAAIAFAWIGKPKSAAAAGITAAGLWAGAWIAEQASVHIATIGWLVLAVIVTGAGLYAWGRRRSIEKLFQVDLDRDGHIGRPPVDDDETERNPVIGAHQ